MMEEKLRKHIGKNEPFKVPEGYFENFAERLQCRIEQLPQKEKKPVRRMRLVPKAWFAAAASVVIVAAMGLSVMVPKWKNGEMAGPDSARAEIAQAKTQEGEAPAMEMDYNYLNEELDYAMIDDYEIAYYLTEY